MRLPPLHALALFALGALGGLVGDASHVASGTTRYLTHGAPFVWESPVWFPALVGGATVSLAELRLHMRPAARTDGGWGDGLEAIAAVVGLYAVTALVSLKEQTAAVTLVAALALIAGRRIGVTRAALVCAALAATVGPAVEIGLVAAGVFEYQPYGPLFGVPLWLPLLYGLFGVVAARLGELSAAYSR